MLFAVQNLRFSRSGFSSAGFLLCYYMNKKGDILIVATLLMKRSIINFQVHANLFILKFCYLAILTQIW